MELIHGSIHGDREPRLATSSSPLCRLELNDVQLRIAALEGPVLISGETGTGKTVLAQELHYHSPRANKSVLVKGCGEFVNSPGLIDSALFGHMKNAFTGATSDREGVLVAADGGTLILDDIDYLPIEGQQKLLRFLDDRKVSRVGAEQVFQYSNIRLIVTTNKDLQRLIDRGEFLRDLYYRLSTWRMSIAPLRETPERIAEFSGVFLDETIKQNPTLNPSLKLTEGSLELLAAMPWRGNLRDLRNALANVAMRCSGRSSNEIRIEDVANVLFDPVLYPEHGIRRANPKEKDGIMLKLLHLTEWNVQKVARVLKISRTTVYAAIDRNGWKK